jgi:hypothetical protein
MSNDFSDDDFGGDEFFNGRSANDYYMIDLPKGMKRFKVDKAMTVQAVIVPYITTNSPYRDPGKPFFTRDYYMFRGLGPDQKQSYFDCAATFNEPCPVGDYFREQKFKKKAQRKALFNLYILNIDGVDVNELRVLDHSYFNFAAVLGEAKAGMMKRKGREWLNYFYHPVNGASITWDFKEEMYDGSKFYKAANFEFEKHNGLDGKVSELVSQAADLDACLNKLDYDDAKRRFIQGIPVGGSKQEAPKDEAKGADTSTKKPDPVDDKVAQATAAATSKDAFDADADWT